MAQRLRATVNYPFEAVGLPCIMGLGGEAGHE
jgi:hypothetical protein